MDPVSVIDKSRHYDVAVIGAGYAGLMAALRLGKGKKLPRVVLINASDRFVERVRLQESIVTEVAPRIPSLSVFLAGSHVEFICGNVISLDAEQRSVRVTSGGQELEIGFGEAIYALGSCTEVESVPGAAEHAYRLESVEGPRFPSALRARLQEKADGRSASSPSAAPKLRSRWPAKSKPPGRALGVTMVSRVTMRRFQGRRRRKRHPRGT